MASLTKMFPFLTPIRVWQKNFFYIRSMLHDKNTRYASKKQEELPYEICSFKTKMINENSGHDIVYQQNKVHNLKIISKTIQQVCIYPEETFSFCLLTRNSRRYGKYKKGLVSVDNKIVAQKGGGVCHLSNLLHYLFLMSPLTVVERHGHKVKSFPNPDKDSLEGIDATIYSGWLDLKAKNNTQAIYQIIISFDEEYMYGKIMSNIESSVFYEIVNENFHYVKKEDGIYESVEVVRLTKDKNTQNIVKKEKLYNEVVKITYELPKDVEVQEI